ncbi:MAG: type II toxin-antitoxin system PemK/MazF family toxin [Gammaproteobacteria bacterium]|nr:type II toxin-antitoxin system PemK/MazF family toxin [Gammaproteobacteria bacterium]
MRCGEVCCIGFDPAIGGEIRKTRPVVIASNNAANKALNRIQMVPLTSNVDRLYPCEAYVHIHGKLAKAMADQIATVSKQRLGTRLGSIDRHELTEIERALRIQLGLVKVK